MGNTGYLFYERRLEKINDLYNFSGGSFRDLREQVFRQGNRDWILRRQKQFMENYKDAFEKYSHFTNYKQWQIILDYYKRNPEGFYNSMKTDIELKDLDYNSDETFTEAEFDRFLEIFFENSPDAEKILEKINNAQKGK